jgi:hypothetical protein
MRASILHLTILGVLVSVISSGGVNAASPEATVCRLPGVLSSMKLPADTAEVANECSEAGMATVAKAIWWGGYIDWEPGDPEFTTFHVRFYEDIECTPEALIAEYLWATPDTTHLGNCNDGLPCFMYELDVSVDVGPGPFWMSIQMAINDRPPPKWGRLGDEVLDGCASQWRPEGDGEWDDPPVPPDWDASHEFEIGPPTPVKPTTWGTVKSLYR